MTALRFLDLIDSQDRPTDSLKSLVRAYGTPQWKAELQGVLRLAYADLFALPLDSISPQEFYEAFKKSYPCEGETLRKGVTFFLNAGRDAGVAFSPFLTKNAKPRSGPPRRKVKTNGANAQGDSEGGGGKTPTPKHDDSKITLIRQQLLEKFPDFDPAWSDDLKTKWFEGYEKLLKMG